MTTMKKLSVCAAVVCVACGDPLLGRRITTGAANLAIAFASVPVGYSYTQSTYDATAEGAGAFFPRASMGGLGRGPGAGIGGGMGPMIGGGLGGDFLGGVGLGRGFGRGHHGDPALDTSDCTYSGVTGRVTCAAVTVGGVTITRSVAFSNAAGAPQSAFDSIATNTANTRVTVAGTVTRRDSAVSVVANSSDRTVVGLASGSTRHTINGTASGSEHTTGTDSDGAFSASRTAADTVRDIVVPVVDSGRTYPTSGTIIRLMHVSVTLANGTSKQSSRREVITYDGTSTARILVTQDGTTKACTLPLPFGRPTCE